MVLFGWDIWSSSDASEKKFGGGEGGVGEQPEQEER